VNLKLFPTILCLPFLLSFQAAATDIDQAQLKKEAVSIVQRFGGSLKPELKKAMKAGGPTNAISVCAEKAPAIAEGLRVDTGWYVKRVSLKARNNQTAIPDAWEKQVLEQFDQRQANGETAEKMAFSEIVDGKFRFMKAQESSPRHRPHSAKNTRWTRRSVIHWVRFAAPSAWPKIFNLTTGGRDEYLIAENFTLACLCL